jgi:hypothetical protein
VVEWEFWLVSEWLVLCIMVISTAMGCKLVVGMVFPTCFFGVFVNIVIL